jgi:tetratricopeptide (TPR) repeat protein
MLASSPKKQFNRENLARTHWGLAFLNKRQEKFLESEGHYLKAIGEYEVLVNGSPENRDYRFEHAKLQREFGVLLTDQQDHDEDAVKQLSQSVSTLAAIAKEFPSVPDYRFELAGSQRDYAQSLGYLHRKIEAEEQFANAIKTNERLIADQPSNLRFQHSQGITFSKFGDLLIDHNQPTEALTRFGQAIQILTMAYVQDRQVTLTKRALCQAHENRALALDQLVRHADALADWDKVLELCEPEMEHIHRSQRADSRLRSGNVEFAIGEVAELAKVDSRNPNHWFRFAKLFAIASDKIPGHKEEYALRAIELLKKAIGLGFSDLTQITEDQDLALLNTREDFQQVLDNIR